MLFLLIFIGGIWGSLTYQYDENKSQITIVSDVIPKGMCQTNWTSEDIYDEYTYDFKVRFKKALIRFKKEFWRYSDEPVYESIYLAVALKDDLLMWKQDADEYAQAVLNGGDTSKWDERWSKLPPITYEMIDAAKKGAAEKRKAYREKQQSPF